MTATTATDHNLTTGDVVSIRGALESLSITSLTREGSVATATTASNHDLTEGFQDTVNISGADQSEYNGAQTLLSVPSETTFTFSVSDSATTPATGTILLNEDKAFSYNGVFNITVTSSTTFTYTVTRDLSVENGVPEMSINPRIWPVPDIDRAVAAYSEQDPDKYALFLTQGSTTANRDRDTRTDASYEYIRGQEYRQTFIQSLDLYVFAPTADTVNAGNVRDTLEDVRFDLIKSLAGAFLDSGSSDTARRAVTYVDDDLEQYNGAYLVYRYTFENVYDITNDDIFEPLDSVVIQNLEINYLNDFDVIIKSDTKEF
ncbi:hypothetical protein KAR91_10535 [Candidatus Pacearchaeota archaeon]|nr:hypothetical protein [Candidatus Pacearchaeota archaeon]